MTSIRSKNVLIRKNGAKSHVIEMNQVSRGLCLAFRKTSKYQRQIRNELQIGGVLNSFTAQTNTNPVGFRSRFYSRTPERLNGIDGGKNEFSENKSNSQEEEIHEEDDLLKKVDLLEKELSDAKSRVMYTLAEMENVRAISRRDAEISKKFAVQGFAKALLDVADNMSRAVKSIESSEAEVDEKMSVLLEGVKMTELQLLKVFEAHGLERFGNPGDDFDPHLHEALFEYSDATMPNGSIGQVVKSGYRLHDRVIRAAQVGCIKNK